MSQNCENEKTRVYIGRHSPPRSGGCGTSTWVSEPYSRDIACAILNNCWSFSLQQASLRMIVNLLPRIQLYMESGDSLTRLLWHWRAKQRWCSTTATETLWACLHVCETINRTHIVGIQYAHWKCLQSGEVSRQASGKVDVPSQSRPEETWGPSAIQLIDTSLHLASVTVANISNV